MVSSVLSLRQSYYLAKLARLLIVILFALVAGLRVPGMDKDSLTYLELYHYVVDSSFSFVIVEPSFTLISYFCSTISKEYGLAILFIIYAFLGVTLKYVAIMKLLDNPLKRLLAFYLYICFFYLLHEYTQIRAGVASGILMISVYYLFRHEQIKYFFLVSCACLFHYSSIIFFIVPLLLKFRSKYIYILMPAVSGVVGFSGVTMWLLSNFSSQLPQFLSYKVQVYLNLKQAVNLYSVFNPVYFFAFMISSVYLLKFSREGSIQLLMSKLLSLGVSFYYCFIALPAFSYRIAELFLVFLIILLPGMIQNFRGKFIYVCLLFVLGIFMISNRLFLQELVII